MKRPTKRLRRGGIQMKRVIVLLALSIAACSSGQHVAGTAVTVDHYDVTYRGGDGAFYRTNFSMSGILDFRDVLHSGDYFEIEYFQEAGMPWQTFEKITVRRPR